MELDEGVGAAPIDDLPDFAELFGEEGGEEPKEDPGKADEGRGDARDDLEEKVKELKKPPQLRTLYLAQPLLSRKGSEVLHAIQNFTIQLKPRLGFNFPPNPPRTGEEPKLRALRTMREEPESPQTPMRVRVRWGCFFSELMYATGEWNRP